MLKGEKNRKERVTFEFELSLVSCSEKNPSNTKSNLCFRSVSGQSLNESEKHCFSSISVEKFFLTKEV